MIWYKYLYLGETAKKHRFSILQKLRLGKVQPGVHVITPASGGHNLLDILPAYPAELLPGAGGSADRRGRRELPGCRGDGGADCG